ncbi:transcriptional repressor NrdR, partial [bacterium]|nr:transcriptional repressor NrdR [bacterium]
MECPFCKCKTTKVVDKRDNREDNSTRRRRQCLRCSKRFTTYERIENIGVNIIKKDGSLVKFNTEKIIKGISKAVDFNKISKEQIEEFAEELEMEALNKEESMTT